MKTKTILLFIQIIGLLHLASCTGSYDKDIYDWSIQFNQDQKTLTFKHKNNTLLKGVSARFKLDSSYISSSDYPKVSVEQESLNDKIGSGQKVIYSFSGLENMPDLSHVFYFYEDRPYFLTETYLTDKNKDLKSNYIAPIYTVEDNLFLEKSASNRVLRVPFDNDNFVPYLSHPLTVEDTSSEVTAFFNGENRQGLIIGSIEHDTWKTGIHYQTVDSSKVSLLECFGGLANELTRDVSEKEDRPSCEHGYVKGNTIKSPKIILGYFEDWRRGMETYGEICATIAPPRKWEKGTPFGWNSWAAMATKVNYEGAIDVSDFIKSELQENNFSNDNIVYIGLDSFWDNFKPEQLKEFVEHCHKNGQKAGIYWCPFSDWYGNPEAYVEGTNNEWKYKDIYLYAPNGKPRKIESLAVDPTHPATKKRIDHNINMFKEMGYEYIKLDFINNGTLEAVSFYNPDVTTGKQAYNEGMSYLTDVCGDNMFLALSIAPTFPSQYGTSKRISCDAWGAMTEGEIGTTGYMLNSLSFGWWLDRVYPFNDADHILLYQPNESADYQLGANRARITSAVITGIYMLGDNFSSRGSLKGDMEARIRAAKVTTNKDINDIARIGKSFYPVEGYKAKATNKTETQFMLKTSDYTYLAIFNFNKQENIIDSVDCTRLGIDAKASLSVKELWTSEFSVIEDGKLHFNIPPQDVRVYRIESN